MIVDCDYFRISRVSDEYAPEFSWDPSYNDFGNSIHIYKYYEENSPDYRFDLIKFTKNVKTLPKDPSIEVSYVSYNGRTQTESRPYYNSLFWLTKAKVLDLEECPWTEMVGHDFQEIMVETLKLPKNLTKINDEMFYKARVVNPIELPETVTSIGKSAFAGSNIIVSNNLPNNLLSIGEAAFYNSKINDNIVIPSTVTSIGKSAFATCPADYNYCVGSFITWNNDKEVIRNSITFESALDVSVTNGQTLSQLLWNSSVDHLIFGDNVIKLPSTDLNEGETVDASTSEFWNVDVSKITFKNLVDLPKKAFIENTNIKEIDFSGNPNLNTLSSHAFYNATNLSKVKLYHGSEVTIGAQAFRGTGLTTIGNEYSDFDIVNNQITLDGDFAFSFMSKLKDVTVTRSLNNGIVPKGTFYSDKLLEKVVLEDDVKELKQEAFGADDGLKTFVMYGDTKIYGKDKNQKITLSDIDSINLYLDTEENFMLKINDSTISKTDFIDNKYVFIGSSDITIESTGNIILDIVSDNTIYVRDIKNDYLTISATANLYCYLKNEDCNDYTNTYKELKNSYTSDLYYLDEVLYLDSNQVTLKLTNDKKDIKKEGLSLYALRRDGVILISDEWGKNTDTKKFVDSGITMRDYDSETTDPRKKVFNTNRDLSKIDITTNTNFDKVTYEIGEVNPETGRANVLFHYPNIIVETEATTTLKTKGNYVDIIYADGCGGESFVNVIYKDILIGDSTPSFIGTPTREGYEFIGWDKKISDKAEEDIIYTAMWRKIENDYPVINKDIPTKDINNNIVNPLTKNNILVLIISLLISLIITFRKNLFKIVKIKRNS